MYCHQVLIIALLAFAGCRPPALPVDVEPNPVPALIGKPAPNFSAPRLNGETFQLSDNSANKVVLLDFWASWCGPCLLELPTLISIADKYKDRGVVLYAINQGEDSETIQSFLDNSKWSMNVVLDSNGDISTQYEVDGIPHLVLIDQRGIVRHIHVGYHPSVEDQVRREIDQLLGEEQPAEKQPAEKQPSEQQPAETQPAKKLDE